MTKTRSVYHANPRLDLVLERSIAVPPALVWKVWTEPRHLMPWFCPLPWKTAECEIDLRPGGVFRTLLQGPAGEENPVLGCYLEIVKNERLVWTTALVPGFRPASKPFLSFTAMIEMKKQGKGTAYRATAMHQDEPGAKQHAEMGFKEGWGKATDQLAAYAATLHR